MSILIDENTRCIVQGITGKHGSFHTKQMLDFGTKIVAGVTPGKANEQVEGVSVYNNVNDALVAHNATWSVLFVPAQFAKNAAIEALHNDLNLVIITEGIPVHDALAIINLAKQRKKIVIGPNCPGILSVGKSKLGIIPNHIVKRGDVGIISRSGTLTYEVIHELTQAGIGQNTIVGLGGDSIIGNNFIDILKLFEKDKETKNIVLIGEIGGTLEEETAEFIEKTNYMKKHGKQIIAFIAGRSAPKGKTMGHAGAIISGNYGTAESKIKALEKANVRVAKLPSEIVKLI